MVRISVPESFTASHHAAVKHTSAMLVPAQDAEPTDPDEGQLWYDKPNKKMKVREI